MRRITRMRRAVTAVAAGAGLVLALGACGDGEDTEGDAGDGGDPVSQTGGSDGAAGSEGTDTDAATATEGADPAAEEVAGARAGLASWLEENKPETAQTSTDIPDCPAITVERMEEALGAAGHEGVSLASWGTEIEWSEYEALHPDLMGIVCGGDSDGDTHDSEFGTASGVFAVDLAGKSDFESLLSALDVADADSVQPPEELGGDLRTACFEDGPPFCVAIWHSDGLVLGTSLIADDADEEAVQAMLVDLLPDVLDSLAQA
ncbi:hypothetical protein [Ornithinicoccus hortensis]|nr:hypothetical protein [Ornithinicoccus hortensis]